MKRFLTIQTVIVNFSIVALGLVTAILLSRWLGPAGRGELAAAMLWPTLLTSIGSIGIMSSTLYFTALPESDTRIIFANGIVFTVVQSSVLMPLGYIAMPWLMASQDRIVISGGRLYLLSIPIILATQYGLSILQGRMHITAFNLLRLSMPVGYLIGVMALAMTGHAELLHLLTLLVILTLLVLIGTVGALIRFRISLGFRPDLSLLKRMLNYGFKVQLGDVSQLANIRLDQVLIAAWLPPAQLGLYVAAVSSAAFSLVLSGAVRMVITPSITREESPTKRMLLLQSTFHKFLVVNLLMTLTIALVIPFALPVVYGVNFREAIWPAEILLIGAFLGSAKDVLTGGVQALGNPWLSTRSELAAMCVTMLLLPLLLPRMGIMGAAIVSSIAYATVLALVVYGLNRSYDVSPGSLLFGGKISFKAPEKLAEG